MDLKKFLELPATGDFRLLNKIDNITDIPVENISLLEPPVEKFVRRHEIILSQALTVRDNETDLKQFIEELYLAGASAVVFAFPGNDFHMLDNILPIYSAKNFPILSMDWDHLFSEVVEETLKEIWKNENEIQTYLEALQRDLLNHFIQGKSLEDAAEVCYKYLGSDIVILDINHKIVGRNSIIRRLSPAGYLKSRTGEIKRLEIANSGRQYGFLLLDNTVFDLNFHSASAVQCINTPLTLWFDREYAIMASRMKSKEDFIWKLAHHEFESLSEVCSKAELLELDISGNFNCILAKVSTSDFNVEGQSNVFIEELALKTALDYKLKCLVSLQHDILVIFLENKNESNTRNQIEDYIASFEKNCEQNIPATAFLWGYDSMGRPVDTLNLGYKNAQKALEFCIDSDGAIHCKCFQFSISEKIISLLRNDEEIRLTASNILNSLKNYDTIYNSDYTDTLKTYIKANYNISEAARLSNLHRQSLIYRLDKIEALTGLSLKNHEDLFTLELCLMM